MPNNPCTPEDRDMITHFDDFCLYVTIIVDNIWDQIAPSATVVQPAVEAFISAKEHEL